MLGPRYKTETGERKAQDSLVKNKCSGHTSRWPGEDDYKSDAFRIIHSRGEESQQRLPIILDKGTANCVCVEKVPRYHMKVRQFTVKLKGKHA